MIDDFGWSIILQLISPDKKMSKNLLNLALRLHVPKVLQPYIQYSSSR